MKFYVFLLLLLSFEGYAQNKKCLLVLVDGIPRDVLKNTDTPNLDKISKNGGFGDAYVGGEKGGASESPTISAVGYNSMLTGTWANKHNVWGNAIKAPNYSYPTIFKVTREAKPNLNLGIFSTWKDNRTKLLGEGLSETDHLKINFVFDGYENDTVLFPHDKERLFIKNIDDLVVKKASETITLHGPDLSWVYLEYTDDMGHKFGDSPQMTDAVKHMDNQIGVLWSAIEKREKEFDEDWLLIITTDHGRDEKTGRNHGGQSDRERATWIITNKNKLNNRFNNGLAIVDIFPTVVNFLDLTVDKKVLSNLDGLPFID
ncbi:alkaline phosphatase family protein [Lacihabitans lacunae]|uniref:Alkaline phosphatase family protein n=1 Tax=Lacihabitans lacunae TaxID=1028214 RepID=A0ABV7Z170_9BACT